MRARKGAIFLTYLTYLTILTRKLINLLNLTVLQDSKVIALNLRKYVLEVLSTEWTTTEELAEILSANFSNGIMFKTDYRNDKRVLSSALGPTLYGLRNEGLVEHDGTAWPKTKRWRIIAKEEQTSLGTVVKSLMQMGYAQNENQALRILALRAIRENPDDYKQLVEEATKMEETKKRLVKIVIGTKRKSAGAQETESTQ